MGCGLIPRVGFPSGLSTLRIRISGVPGGASPTGPSWGPRTGPDEQGSLCGHDAGSRGGIREEARKGAVHTSHHRGADRAQDHWREPVRHQEPEASRGDPHGHDEDDPPLPVEGPCPEGSLLLSARESDPHEALLDLLSGDSSGDAEEVHVAVPAHHDHIPRPGRTGRPPRPGACRPPNSGTALGPRPVDHTLDLLGGRLGIRIDGTEVELAEIMVTREVREGPLAGDAPPSGRRDGSQPIAVGFGLSGRVAPFLDPQPGFLKESPETF